MSRGHFIGLNHHRQMLADRLRMEAYQRAIDLSVRPGMRVMDLGTGTGILAMWAARAGAKVTAIEPHEIIEVAKKITAAIGYEPCAFGNGLCHADLVELLGSALTEALLGRAPNDVDHGRLHVVGHGEAGNGVGVAWGREHRHARLAGDASVGVGHVDGGLLVAGVDEPKAFVGHAVHQCKGVVPRDDEYGVNALGLEGSYYEVYALHLVCLRDGTVSLLRRGKSK